MKDSLAIYGGNKTITYKFKKYNTIGVEEINITTKVLQSGVLSKFIGSWNEDFYGGEYVKKLEENVKTKYNVKYAVAVNSWTSGLICAIGALDIEPGDEVILSPFTMSACAASILHWNAIPVFVDIEPETFNINPELIEEKISSKTKAIMAIDIFGHSCDIESINKIAKKHNLKVITDSAQSPWSFLNKKNVGTLSDIGGFSLNYHKHIHTGEGGIIVTNNLKFYTRMTLIRNHAEAVVEKMGIKDINNMIGFNFRMGEIEAAIGIEQLKKLDSLVSRKQQICNNLIDRIKHLDGLTAPITKKNHTHSYYCFAIKLDLKKVKVSRSRIVKALQAEGVEGISEGYSNLHLLPIFQKKIGYGKSNFPWSITKNGKLISYEKGICPIAEKLHDKSLILFQVCLFEFSDHDIELIGNSFKKVWSNMEFL